ncbi:hypothetical protein AUEXF2481DRAFT_5138 [Aureobasidium subglaciale EXF-2481]|uniref:NTF2-like domain-containing protein n=1 Tax=Aureobasidium subglaciale (strain EXF-2481) TaxID=1043005 RepID=A0A074YHI5_AURSE|nr:uncharacterized protein AUEXF2481DRAFT_5138 [Aureobasidium subglaciale EXF-2481]KAI5209187.1 hypothetical protein E4T38_02560 [Aureobasidium subglaciale]KAI5228180.1 hypothetical protein E4T40_02339 [Aureobasidium subglaciale]KAI5231369.1 hypothetical protein E4T41_02559 [Aureobasidium subglaciale]KAI5265499.1 hypothetical protein E4T46_02337 [Aureobasidium subglaciale]KEQ95539.1 hypothetical protein AUEXF2481DRAFT_5138 [Aureobasidium subglaciale EXF-2481]
MRTSIAAAVCPFMGLVFCTAQPFNNITSKATNNTSTTSCISPADAILIANGFGQILSNFTTSWGDVLIADDYIDQSDSVATLMHSPNVLASDLGKTTFSSKASFLAGEAAQPGVPFSLLNTWSSCDAVTFRYVLSPPGLDVQGIAVAEVVEVAKNETGKGVGEGSQKWQIKTFYGEFNSAVWLTDLKDGIVGCDVSGNVTVAGNETVV